MATVAPAEMAVVSSETTAGEQSSYIDWPAIIAGIVLASAISIILLAFGSAVGLSFTNFHARHGAAPIWIGIAAGLWLLWVQISSFLAGGYLTGRMRRRFHDASEHESDVRDGAHGLLVWAGAAVLGSVIVLGGVGAAANAVGSAAQTATLAASNTASGTVDPNAYFIDTLFRSNQPVDAGVARSEAGRIFANAALQGSEVSAEDKAYLVSVVAANTGLSPDEAASRVDQVAANVESARQQAIAAAETARKTGVVAAFLLAASLLVSAVGAYWAASMGGRHRDEQTVFATVFPRY